MVVQRGVGGPLVGQALGKHLFLCLVTAGVLANADPVSGPILLADINPHGLDGMVMELAVAQGHLFFGATQTGGIQMHNYHPDSGLKRVSHQLVKGTESINMHVCEFDGKVYFQSEVTPPYGSGPYGIELTKLDLQYGNAELAHSFVSGPVGSKPAFMTVFQSRLFLSAMGSEAQGRELWSLSNRMSATLEHEFSSTSGLGGDPKYLTVFINKLYMQADSHDAEVGVELYSYLDGRGVELVADINPGAASSNCSHMAVANNLLYMSANGGNGAGQELWAYDGTDPPSMVVDIFPGSASSSPQWLIEFGSTLFFFATTQEYGTELFRLQGGTTAELVAEAIAGPEGGKFGKMAVLDGVLFIPCYFKHLGWELHRLSESGDAIELELDVYPGGAGSTPSLFTLHDSEVFFAADDGVQGGALWKYNSTHGATLAATISPNVDLSAGVGMVSFGKSLVFAADYPGAGIEPVKFDPVTSQVTLLADIEQGPTGVSAKHFCVLGSRLFFTVFDTISTSQLYQYSDAGGASEVQSSPENPSYLAAVGDVLFMAGSDSAHGAELWKFTEQGGAELARDIKAGPSSSSPVQLEAGAHVLFMVAETDSSPSSNRPRLCSYNPSTDEFHDSVEPVFLGVTMLMPFSNSVLFRARTQSYQMRSNEFAHTPHGARARDGTGGRPGSPRGLDHRVRSLLGGRKTIDDRRGAALP